jgi:hypothetical protein
MVFDPSTFRLALDFIFVHGEVSRALGMGVSGRVGLHREIVVGYVAGGFVGCFVALTLIVTRVAVSEAEVCEVR